jgi:heavy metal sensor kinase
MSYVKSPIRAPGSGLETADAAPEPRLSRPTPFARLRPRSLRAQLALWHGVLLALTLLLLAAFTYLLLREYLNHSADAALTEFAETTGKDVAAAVYHYRTLHPGQSLPPEVEQHFIDTTDLQSWGRYVQVIDEKNNPVAFSDALRTHKLPLPSGETLMTCRVTGKPVFDTVTSLGQYPVRMVTLPVQLGSQIPYLVQVGASVEGVEGALQRALFILLVLTPAIFLIALLGGWALVGSSLRPVDEMTRAALSIESKRLDMRIAPPRSDNEIGRLAGALNEMIARLDRSFQQIERFTADASHELKTPLTAIRGEAEVALMSAQTPETQATLRSIIAETERLSSIVNNLLLLSRADADQVRLNQDRVALHEIVLTTFETLERLARRKNIALDFADMEEVTVQGDALWLQQLFTNLIHNAINYTPEGGRVTLSLSAIQSGEPERRWASFAVDDTGPGIPAEHLPFLFDRFYRVDSGRSREQGGSGLGLNIARWVAESHGGKITISSTVGKGTVFTVLLPIGSESENP